MAYCHPVATTTRARIQYKQQQQKQQKCKKTRTQRSKEILNIQEEEKNIKQYNAVSDQKHKRATNDNKAAYIILGVHVCAMVDKILRNRRITLETSK